MILIATGLALWAGAHLWKRIAPASRARAGDKGKGIVAGVTFLGLILMIIGYITAETTYYWGGGTFASAFNNAAMLFVFYLFAASGAKTRITRRIRHPQLTAVIIFTLVHMLVNGDSASLLLFGGLFVWAVVEIQLINRAEPVWEPAHDVPIRKEFTAILATIVVYVAVVGIHTLVGPNPFGWLA